LAVTFAVGAYFHHRSKCLLTYHPQKNKVKRYARLWRAANREAVRWTGEPMLQILATRRPFPSYGDFVHGFKGV